MKLKPCEFYELDLMEFDDMLKAHEQAELARRWEIAYWVSGMMGVHVKNGVRSERLMKPFLPKEEIIRTKDDCDDFFDNFYKQRKGV